jgi:DNA segregation ATPase FtsK/SpoIIIE-like protein
MNLTKDFHVSQVALVLITQRYSHYGSLSSSFIAFLLFLSIPFQSNDFAKGFIFISQLAATANCFKLSRLNQSLASENHLSVIDRANEGLSNHLAVSYAPPKRDVVVMEQIKPMPSHPILRALYNQKLECDFAGELKSPSFVRTLVKPTNCTASKVLGIGKELHLELALDSPPIISISKGAIAIDTPRSDRQIARFSDYWKPSQKVEAAIGVDINNKLVSIDLSHPETCHILAAGTTGSGKSVWLQSLLLSLLIGRSPQELLVVICDPKRVSFFAFEDCANLLVPIIYTPEEVILVGNWLIAEMMRRYEMFAEYKVENIDQYNAKVSKSEQLPRIFFLNDEYGDLKSACGDDKEGKAMWAEIMDINIRLGQMARASGISEGIVTQKAVDVIDKKIRSNLPARVLLKVLEEGDTECLLGKQSYDGRDLLGRGDLFFNGDRLQSLLCEPGDFAKLTKGDPVYSLDDLAEPSNTITVKSSEIVDTPKSQITAPTLKAIINYLDGRDWVRDNLISQSITEFKVAKTPIAEVQGYLQYLEVQGYVETRNAGRNGLEARKI